MDALVLQDYSAEDENEEEEESEHEEGQDEEDAEVVDDEEDMHNPVDFSALPRADPSQPHCVMYDKCGSPPDTPWVQLPCAVQIPPQVVDDHDLHTLEHFCPELVAKYNSTLCCSQSQILDLSQNLALPQSIISRCPSCYYNFRQLFCELACSPLQSTWVNVSKTILEPKKSNIFPTCINLPSTNNTNIYIYELVNVGFYLESSIIRTVLHGSFLFCCLQR